MGRGGKHRRLRHFGQQHLNVPLGPEARVGIHTGEVWKCFRYALTRLAVRHDGSQLELRMAGDEAQQLACNIAGSTQNNGGDPCGHCGAFTPIASMTRSPSAAPFVMALKAGTPSWSVMISTPTWLSVEGPVTTHGSMPKRSRSSLTPPHAATG